MSIQHKFDELETALNNELVERSKEIHTAILALLSRRHHFQLGSPGTGKSLLVTRLAKRISGLGEDGYFHWLLTRYSTPEELYGPPDIGYMLEQKRYKRNTAYKMPVAKIVFVDEIWKGNSSILNANLTIMHERKFFNDGLPINVPLSTLYAASNEMPQGEELSAMWDRLHFRHEVRPIQDTGNFIKMLSGTIPAEVEPILTWEEILLAQQQVRDTVLRSDIYDTLQVLRQSLANEGIEPTERRWMESLDIIRAEAWTNERGEAEIDDLRVLRHVMWAHPDQQKIVSKCVLELANPIDQEANDLLDRIEGLDEQLTAAVQDSDNTKAVAKHAVEIHSKLTLAKKTMDELEKRVQESGKKSEIFGALKAKFEATTAKLMKEGFGIDKL